MGHQIVTKELRERPEIREKIDNCQNLIDTLTECKEAADGYQSSADSAAESCNAVVYEECEYLSGIYHDDIYIPYRDGFFEDIGTLDEGCATMFGEIDEIIEFLEEMISELEKDLYEEVEVVHWIYDD